MLRKLTLLVALAVVALTAVQGALAAPKHHGNGPNGNAWGQTTWSDGR